MTPNVQAKTLNIGAPGAGTDILVRLLTVGRAQGPAMVIEDRSAADAMEPGQKGNALHIGEVPSGGQLVKKSPFLNKLS